MIFLDTITSSPLNVILTIVLGLGIVYYYYKKPPASSSSSSSSSSNSRHHHHHLSSSSSASFVNNNTSYSRSTLTNSGSASRSAAGFGGGGVISDELRRTIEQIERQERDMIRQEQDEAYQKSLKADREKQIKREEELRIKEAQEREEKEKLQRLQHLHQRLLKLRSEILSHLPSQPNHDQNDTVKLVFKLPDGTRVKRAFCLKDKVKYLYWYVFSLNNAPLQFKMTTNFPKRDLPGRPPKPEDFDNSLNKYSNPTPTTTEDPNCEQSLQEVGLTETQIIFVYDLEA